MAGPPRCQSCGDAVSWGVTTTGGRMPLNVTPSQLGNVWRNPDGKLRVLNKEEAARGRAAGVVLWMPHHATCPSAGRYAVGRDQTALDVGA